MPASLSRRRFAGLSMAGGAALAGCGGRAPEAEAMPDMGTFQLAAPITVAGNAKRIPPSREAGEAELKAAMNDALVRRLGGYAGGTPFYVALAVDGYALAPPGIPVVMTPKSILVVSANVWRADPQEKIGGPEQLTVFEDAGGFLLGSGLTRDADEQLAVLARNMAAEVQRWMLRNPAWFGLPA